MFGMVFSTVERIELAPTSLKVLIGTFCKRRHLVGAFSENGTSIHVSVYLWLSLVLCAGALTDNDVLPVGDPQLGRVLLVKMEDVQILK